MVGFSPLTNNHFFNLHGGFKKWQKRKQKRKKQRKRKLPGRKTRQPIISNYRKAVIAYAVTAFLYSTMFHKCRYYRMTVLKTLYTNVFVAVLCFQTGFRIRLTYRFVSAQSVSELCKSPALFQPGIPLLADIGGCKLLKPSASPGR